MFLSLPFQFNPHAQKVALVLNTVFLIIALIVTELFFASASKKKKANFRYFYPIIVVAVGIFAFAVYKQVKAA